MNYQEWESAVPEAIKADSLWKMTAYRLALLLADLEWHDVTKLKADQLYRAIGSISANLSEGYSRGTGKDRDRFYEYALGSARESRDWYFKARHILGDAVTDHRLETLTEVIRLLLTMVPQQRGRALREEGALYSVDQDDTQPDISIGEKLDDLLNYIPLPDP